MSEFSDLIIQPRASPMQPIRNDKMVTIGFCGCGETAALPVLLPILDAPVVARILEALFLTHPSGLWHAHMAQYTASLKLPELHETPQSGKEQPEVGHSFGTEITSEKE